MYGMGKQELAWQHWCKSLSPCAHTSSDHCCHAGGGVAGRGGLHRTTSTGGGLRGPGGLGRKDLVKGIRKELAALEEQVPWSKVTDR
jgi:hypothetical protein